MTKAERIFRLEESIEYWERQRGKIVQGRSGHTSGIVIFCDEYGRGNGLHNRANIPAHIAYELVLEKLDEYLQSLRREKSNLEKGGVASVLEIVKGFIPKHF